MSRYAKIVDNAISDLNTYLKAIGFRNSWIEVDGVEIYIRLTKRLNPMLRGNVTDIERDVVSCLDIANICLSPHLRNRGIFTEFLIRAHQMNPCQMLYIENVMERRFQEFFKKAGFKQMPSEQDFCGCKSFYAMKNDGLTLGSKLG